MNARLLDRTGGGLPATAGPIQLFCLPYAGGSAAMFHRWAATAPVGVTVIPLELPGHGLRRDEPPVSVMHRLVRGVADQVNRQVSGPYALFGHSLGALLAFETARVLRRCAGEPRALLVSGRNAPSAPVRHHIRDLPDGQLVAAMRVWGGMSPEVARYPALQTRLLRLLRADLRLAETYRPVPDERLRCPLTVFRAQADPLVDRAGVAAWRSETTGPAEVVLVPGGHLCVREPAFETVLRVHLRRMVRRTTMGWRRYHAGEPAVAATPVVA